jgi:hypothetical protein
MAAGGISSKRLKISRSDRKFGRNCGARWNSPQHVWSFPDAFTVRGARPRRQARTDGGGPMKYLLTNLIMSFWASPGSTIYDMILQANSWSRDRGARALMPPVPDEEWLLAAAEAPKRTDAPAHGPQDVPVREPMDVPPPQPSIVPTPAKQPDKPDKKTRPDSDPRPTP